MQGNIMTAIAKLIVVLVGLFSLAMGLMAWFQPAQIQEILGLSPNGALGMHSLRGDIGAVFFGSAIGCALALFKGKIMGLKLPIILYGLVLIGRLLSLVLTGSGEGVMLPIIIEVVLVGASIFAYKTLKSA